MSTATASLKEKKNRNTASLCFSLIIQRWRWISSRSFDWWYYTIACLLIAAGVIYILGWQLGVPVDLGVIVLWKLLSKKQHREQRCSETAISSEEIFIAAALLLVAAGIAFLATNEDARCKYFGSYGSQQCISAEDSSGDRQ